MLDDGCKNCAGNASRYDRLLELPLLWSYSLIQVKSKILLSFRTRQVKVIVPEFIAEAEQQLLGAALKQWHGSAEGVVASSILEVRVIEQRLLHAVYRYAARVVFHAPLHAVRFNLSYTGSMGHDCRLVQHASSDGNTMLELLNNMLTTSAEFRDALAVRCTSAHQTVRQLALYAGIKYMEPAIGHDDIRLHAWAQLIRVLQQHSGQTSWAAALLQVPISQLPGILPALLCTNHEVHCNHAKSCLTSILTSLLDQANLTNPHSQQLAEQCWTATTSTPC